MNYQLWKSSVERQQCYQIERIKHQPFYSQFRFQFPVEEPVTITIAYVENTLSQIGTFAGEGVKIVIQKLFDVQNWVKHLAIRKIMFKNDIGEYLNPHIFLNFDGVILKMGQQQFGVYIGELTVQLTHYFQSNPFSLINIKKIELRYADILRDLHHYQIVLNKVGISDLRYSLTRNKQIIGIGKEWAIIKSQNYGYLQFNQPKYNAVDNPYQRDRQQISQVLKQFANAVDSKQFNAEDSRKQEQYNYETINYKQFSVLLKQIKLMSNVLSQTFIEFVYRYEVIEFVPFKCCQNQALTNLMKQHYRINNRKEDLIGLLSAELGELVAKVMEDCRHLTTIQAVETELAKLKTNKSHFKSEMNQIRWETGSNYSAIKLKITKKHYQLALKAKEDNQFYRAKGHLKQCRNNCNSVLIQSVFLLQESLNNQSLCLSEQAEQGYRQCIKIRQYYLGTQSSLLIVPIYRLMILKLKRNNKQQVYGLHSRMVCLQRSNKMEYCPLSYLNDIIIDYNHSLQVNQVINNHKEEFSKGQTDKSNKFSHCIKLLMDRGDKDDKIVQKCKEHTISGQFNPLQIFMNLIAIVLHSPKYELSTFQLYQINKTIVFMKNTNIKMSYKILFVLSYYYQNHNNIELALSCLYRIQDIGMYIPSVVISLNKRLLQLLNKDGNADRLLQFYLNRTSISHLDMPQLYDCAVFFFNQEKYVDAIKNGKLYIEGIREYSTFLQQEFANNGSNRSINRSQKISIMLVKAYAYCRNYTTSWTVLQSLCDSFYKGKVTISSFYSTIMIFATQCFKGEQYYYCLDSSKLLFQSLALPITQQLPQELRLLSKQFWTANIKSLIALSCQNQYADNCKWIYSQTEGQLKKLSGTQIQQMCKTIGQQAKYNQFWNKLHQQLKNISTVKQESQSAGFKELISQIKLVTQQQTTSINFANLQHKFITLLQSQNEQMQHILCTAIKQIADRAKIQGQLSPFIIFIHLLLLQLLHKLNHKQQELLLLMWLSGIRINFQINQQECQLWTVRSREYRLDQLLFQHLSHQIQLKDKQHQIGPFVQLWWVIGQIKALQTLQAKYNKLINKQQTYAQHQKIYNSIIDFKIKYCSYFTTDPSDSQLLTKLSEMLSQLQFVEQDLDN